MSVVAAFEFHDDLASRGSARQPNGGHGRFSAGADKPKLFNRRVAGNHALGQVALRRRRSAEAGGAARGALDSLHHRWKGVAQNHRPPRTEVVDIAFAVGVEEPRSLRPLDERGLAAYRAKRPHRRVEAAGEEPFGALLKGLRFAALMSGGTGTHSGFSIEGHSGRSRGF